MEVALLCLGLGIRRPSMDFYFYGAVFRKQVTSLVVRCARPFLCNERDNLRISRVWNFSLKIALKVNAVWHAA